METPGKRIQKWREYLRKSVGEFAEMTSIPYSTLKTLETNPEKGKPSFDVLAKLRSACPTLNMEWLFDDFGVEPMLKSDRPLTPPAPGENPRINSDRELVRVMTEEDMRISDTSGPPYRMRRVTRTPEEEMEYLRLELLRERQAHERTRERYETDRNQNHERETKLIALIGGGSFNDASPDAAVTYAAEMRVSHVSPEWKRFVAPQPAAYERRTIGF